MGSSRPDFEILLRAAQRLSLGQTVYQIAEHAEHTKAPGLTWLMQVFLLVPEWLAKGIWDALMWGSLLWLGRLSGVGFSAGVLGWLMAAGPWWAEMRLGQYNLILAALSLGVATWESQNPSRLRSAVLGVVCLLTLLLKPTQLIMIPWMISCASSQGRLKWIGFGFLGLGSVLSAGYSLQWGPSQWVSAHQDWLAFLPLSEAKHLMRTDNLGLATQVARWVGGEAFSGFGSKFFLAFGLVSSIWSVHRWGRLSLRAFTDALFFSVVCSPMAWRQNFSPLFLMLSWAMLHSEGFSLPRKAVFWSCSIAFSLLGADLLGAVGAEAFGQWGGPLWLAILAWWAARTAPHLKTQLSRNF